jgi:hypothetical protein
MWNLNPSARTTVDFAVLAWFAIVLYQGTTSVVPQAVERKSGLWCLRENPFEVLVQVRVNNSAEASFELTGLSAA